jgi:peptidoglycan-associated lipoprotein
MLAFGLLVAGCAKEDVVKKDQSLDGSGTSAGAGAAAGQSDSSQSGQSKLKEEVVPGGPGSSGVAVADRDDAASGKANVQMMLEKVYFAFDSAVLSDAARNSLGKNGDVLKKNSSYQVEIEGHCDERGSDEYNLALGERRAKSAKEYLVTLGIKPERISTISFGKEKPVDPGHTEEAWAKNRRDEFIVKK